MASTPADTSPSRPNDTRGKLALALAIGGVALAYFGAARLGLAVASVHDNVSPVWPATGVAIAALLIGGLRLWPGVLLGAFVANALTSVHPAVAVAIGVGNTLEAVAGAWLVQTCMARWSRMGALAEPAGIAVASAVAPIISAT